jgi:hypothetical protein
MKNDLILCTNFTQNGDPINKTNQFSPANSFIVSMAILDDWDTNLDISLEMIWKHNAQIIVHHKQKFRIEPSSTRHRFESFIKMAFIEYKKLYGPWSVALIIDKKEYCTQEFLITKPISVYGKNLKNAYLNTNSIINVAY